MSETVPLNRRLYLIFEPGAAGQTSMRLSLSPPNVGQAMAALIVRGVLMEGAVVDIDFVTDPAANPDLRGRNGKDGSNGADGKAGTNGVDGQSAYDIARSLGYGGTKTQWLATLVGAAGKDGKDGTNGADGKNASALLGTVNLTQTATVAISAGTRRLIVAIPAGWGVGAGDPLMALPSATVAGYAVHDVVAVSPTSISVGFTAPLLAIGASFTIPLRIARLNT
ncbi:hypothetical protein VH567_15540 [Sphingomonas sp. 4RDLI-65]|uniref:hypothetical protein n=1 Tax=Sphingomonas sp. 4RDLI-65 TaxID=3111641 RepID=UPI003C1F30B3